MTTRVIFAAACVLSLAGCSKGLKQAEPPVVVSVQGTVTYKAKPVPGATVIFRNDNPEHSAFGVADAQGRFTSMTNDTTGMFPGKYRATVTQPHRPKSIPKKYDSIETADLELTVVAGEPVEFPIALSD